MPAPSRPILFASPEDVEHAFYDALSHGDANALMATWSEDDELVCVHPTGVQLIGLDPIRDSWRSIFGSTKLRVESARVAHWQGMLLAIHHLVETLFVGDDVNPHGPLHVTHVYARGAHGWRLVSRHASGASNTPVTTGSGDSEGGSRVLH